MGSRGTALVLGGGGPVGLAWEAGLLAGLAEGGVDPSSARWVVGTSAGAFVGALLSSGMSAARVDALQGALPRRAPRPGDAAEPAPAPSDPTRLAEIFRVWSRAERLDQDVRRRIAGLAIEVAGRRRSPLAGSLARLLEDDAWPPSFEATAVAEDGGFRLFGPASGVSLDAAVAASCAVPGIIPPVEIDGVRYVDGGVRSGTNADVLLERAPDAVLIVAPLSDDRAGALGRQMDRCMRREIALLEEAGVATASIVPDERDREAFGPSMMDAGRKQAAREAGHARGRREAANEALTPFRSPPPPVS